MERRGRLGNEDGNGDGNGNAAALALGNHFAGNVQHVVGQIGDRDDILVPLSRKPHHEIELATTPTRFERGARRALQVFLGNALVDDIAHALATRLGRKRQAALFLARNLQRHVHAKGVQALRGMETEIPVSSRRRLRRDRICSQQE